MKAFITLLSIVVFMAWVGVLTYAFQPVKVPKIEPGEFAGLFEGCVKFDNPLPDMQLTDELLEQMKEDTAEAYREYFAGIEAKYGNPFTRSNTYSPDLGSTDLASMSKEQREKLLEAFSTPAPPANPCLSKTEPKPYQGPDSTGGVRG